MPPTPRDDQAAEELGRCLASLHEQHCPEKKYPQIARELWRFHDVEMSDETCRKYHVGKQDPNSAKVEELRGWTLYYGVPPSALGFIAARRIQRAFALFGGPGDDNNPFDQGIPSSRCIGLLAAA